MKSAKRFWLPLLIAALFVIFLLTASCGGDDDDDNDDDAASGDDTGGDDDDGEVDACGDGVCAEDEDCLTCLLDCACFCGDGVCTFGEFCAVCEEDCDCETLAATPPMGWNSWNKFHCDIDEELIRQTADAMVATGLRDAGYRYLNLDDCWQIDRDEDGTIVADPDRFPGGIPALADYVHERGLKFGLYTCAGTMTCQERPGSYGYEFRDMQTYADWNVDYAKVDWCFTDGLDARERYPVFREAIDAAGGGIVLSICEWGGSAPWTWADGVGELWRSTGDIADFALSMYFNMLQTEPLAAYAAPGAWNDPDMLEVGNGGMGENDYRTHMALWAMMAAPLIAGNDLTAMDAGTREILLNPEVIAVDQDPSGVQGRAVIRDGGVQVWARPLTLDGLRAVLLFNGLFSGAAATVRWEDIGLQPGAAALRDPWTHQDLGPYEGGYTEFLEPFASRMLLVAGTEYRPPAGESGLSALPWKYIAASRPCGIDANEAGAPMKIAGVPYANGLGTSAASLVLYHLGGRCTSLTARAGVDDETVDAESAVFQVWADGELLYDSGIVTKGEAARSVAVDLTGRRELVLKVRPGTGAETGALADWAEPRLTCN